MQYKQRSSISTKFVYFEQKYTIVSDRITDMMSESSHVQKCPSVKIARSFGDDRRGLGGPEI